MYVFITGMLMGRSVDSKEGIYVESTGVILQQFAVRRENATKSRKEKRSIT